MEIGTKTARRREGWHSLCPGGPVFARPLYDPPGSMQTPSQDQLIQRGVDLAAQSRHLDAARCFAQVLEHDPESKAAYTQLGLVYKDMGDADGAVRFWLRAAELDAGDAFVRINLGLTFFQAGVLPEAKDFLGQAADLMQTGLDAAHAQADATDAITRVRLLAQCGEVEETLAEVHDLLDHIRMQEERRAA